MQEVKKSQSDIVAEKSIQNATKKVQYKNCIKMLWKALQQINTLPRSADNTISTKEVIAITVEAIHEIPVEIRDEDSIAHGHEPWGQTKRSIERKFDSEYTSKTYIEVWSVSRFGDTIKIVHGKDGDFSYEVQLSDNKGRVQITSFDYRHLALLFECLKKIDHLKRSEEEEKEERDKVSLTKDEVKAAIEARNKKK